jgi:hypothetical protein
VTDSVSLAVTIGLGPAFWRKLNPDPVATADAAERVGSGLEDLIRVLGAQARVTSSVEPIDPDPTDMPISLHVDGRPLLYSEEVFWQALAYVRSAVPAPVDAEKQAAELDSMASAELAEIVALVFHEAAALNPGLLVPDRPAPGIPPATDSVPAIDVCLEPCQLRSLLADDPDGKGFVLLRNLIVEELGISLPRLTVRSDSSLRRNGYAFRINGVRSMPRIGLAADQLMVLQASPEGLGDWGSDWVPSANPATWQPAGIVLRASPDEIESAGPVVWKPYEHMLGDLTGIIRQQAPSFVTAAVVDDMVKGLDAAFPILKQALQDKVPSSLLVAVLRELLSEGIPIRNLMRIAELLLCYQYGAMGSAMDPVAYVRTGMADLIASQVSRGTETVVVYLLDDRLERAAAALDPVQSTAADWQLQAVLCAAVRAELAWLPRTALIPTLLTHDDARRPLRRLLRARFPRLSVVSYSDLPAHFNVQPVARISAPEAEQVS